MSSIANDREIQALMRDFLMCCNRTENAEAKGAEYGALTAMHDQRRAAATLVEECLLMRGWMSPTATSAPAQTVLPSPVRIPETAHR